MGASPPDHIIKRELRRCQVLAEKHNERYKKKVTPRVIRASNGEVAIIYDYYDAAGVKQSILSLKGLQAEGEQHADA